MIWGTQLPVEMGNLTALEYLNLDGNPLLPPFDALRREPYGDLSIVQFLDPFLSELDLTGCGFVELPTLLYRHAHYLLVRARVRVRRAPDHTRAICASGTDALAPEPCGDSSPVCSVRRPPHEA